METSWTHQYWAENMEQGFTGGLTPADTGHEKGIYTGGGISPSLIHTILNGCDPELDQI